MLSKQLRGLHAASLLRSRRAVPLVTCQNKDFMSLMQQAKDRLSIPQRHIKSFMESDGQNTESQLPGDASRTHGNTAANFSAYVTGNSFEMHQWHEMEATVHSQFGTIDNPVLIFTSDSSWRIVICMGPGVEDESHTHEKMYYMVREGPIHRCHLCGQCFKIVRLKDEASDLNDYYSTMFAPISLFEVAEEDNAIPVTGLWHDRPAAQMQTIATTNIYIHVNNDEADRILVDPAYKLEKMTKQRESYYSYLQAYAKVDEQTKSMQFNVKQPMSREIYESWVNVEKEISKFDRIWNKNEKYDARHMNDPANHERREARMRLRHGDRQKDHIIFVGGLSEREEQYRDYYETDLEEDPENEFDEEVMDNRRLAQEGDLNPALYDFVNFAGQDFALDANYDDLIDQKVFKWKYRQFAMDTSEYDRRQNRMVQRFFERVESRDPAVEVDLQTLLVQNNEKSSIGQLVVDPMEFKHVFADETRPIREYMVDESVQQYKDFYESDDEESSFFEYLDNFTNRDKLRMVECFKDYTVDERASAEKTYYKVPKREYNTELSQFQNMKLDYNDFRDRVQPMTTDILIYDYAIKNQRHGNFREFWVDQDKQRQEDENRADFISAGGSSSEFDAIVKKEKELAAQQEVEGRAKVEAADQRRLMKDLQDQGYDKEEADALLREHQQPSQNQIEDKN